MTQTTKSSKWFFPVTDNDSAHAAIKIAYQFAFTLSALQAVIMIFLSWSTGRVSGNLFDPVFMATLGFVLRSRPSRFAATVLFIYSILIVFLTFAAKFGSPIGTFGGKNVVLGVLFVYSSYKGVQGTFGYHRINATKIQLGNILKLVAIIFGYVVFVTLVYFGAMAMPQFQSTFENMSDSLLGLCWLVPTFLFVFLGALGWLPGTRKIEVTTKCLKFEG